MADRVKRKRKPRKPCKDLEVWMESVAREGSRLRWHKDNEEAIEEIKRIVSWNSKNKKKVPVGAAVDRMKEKYNLSVHTSTLKHWVRETLGLTWTGTKRHERQ